MPALAVAIRSPADNADVAEDYRQAARQAAKRYGLDPYIFERQIKQESGFNPSARSPAGAQGIAQIMPATARGWKVDPLDPIAALNAAAKNMASYVKEYGSYENALRAYNAGPGAIERSRGFSETNNYVSTILGGRDPGELGAASGGGSASQRPSASPSVPAAQGFSDPGQAGDYSALLASLVAKPQQAPAMSALPAPAFSAQMALPQGFRALTAEQPQQDRAQGGVGQALGLLESLRGTEPSGAGQAAAGIAETVTAARQQRQVPGAVPLGGSKNAGRGGFQIDGPDPDRIVSGVKSFAEKAAEIYGGTFVGKDGSSHSKFTVNGNVSDHYSGHATDIFQIDGKPAEGERLLRAGRAALIAAGMPRKQALKAQGGLYNVGGHQIIFLTNEGGNHYDHLHISAR